MHALLLSLPPAIIAILYLTFLGHRTDYVGHFLAGYGGTLVVMALGLSWSRGREGGPAGGALVVILLVGCIALGALQEATTFRLAKFDEVDFFNQNLGAILAAAVALLTDYRTAEEEFPFLTSMLAGFTFLAAGFVYAFI